MLTTTNSPVPFPDPADQDTPASVWNPGKKKPS